jgi:hypothetical protein
MTTRTHFDIFSVGLGVFDLYPIDPFTRTYSLIDSRLVRLSAEHQINVPELAVWLPDLVASLREISRNFKLSDSAFLLSVHISYTRDIATFTGQRFRPLSYGPI